MSVGMYDPDFDGAGLRIGIVQARFNEDICHGLRAACLTELKHLGVDDQDVLLVTVPVRSKFRLLCRRWLSPASLMR